MEDLNNLHSADGSFLGFLYQIERALIWLSSSPVDAVVGVEVEDDITVQLVEGSSIKKIYEQAKHSQTSRIPSYGFKYLNSEHGIVHNEAVSEAMTKGLEQINDDSLTDAHNAWIELSNNRENAMLQNICTFSKDYPYEQAVFLLGAAHRKAIIEKIKSCAENQTLKLNWLLYGG